ncbi:hypothetical protein LZ554_003000 [Drepanopeziza brunnea f. sp. 'monogermtubi']|nr:hypothetical protein LZ554_003000 [Drepanopeziza brunnea f. sp. 'monogermtubi']
MQLSLITIRLGVSLSFAIGVTQAEYIIQDSYNATNFFNEFNFFSDKDPTDGFVAYSNADSANSSQLAGYLDQGVYLGVDSTTVNPAGGRGSTRVESKKTYTHGLFISDIAHMPDSTCGVWPAMWTVGGDWPTNGEIDFIEGVNSDTTDTITLHTSPGCNMESTGSIATSTLSTTDCNAGPATAGCSLTTKSPFGTGFNAAGGGVYAMEWTSASIKVWHFTRDAIPADITAGNPSPSLWGPPVAAFSGSGCSIDSHFQKHQIVINTTFCGDWAGKVWDNNETCSKLAPTCDAYVAANPQAFESAFWQINSVKVYQANMAGGAAKRAQPFSG